MTVDFIYIISNSIVKLIYLKIKITKECYKFLFVSGKEFKNLSEKNLNSLDLRFQGQDNPKKNKKKRRN